MKIFPDRLCWVIVRRVLLSLRIPGFWASWGSYVTSDCRFEGNHSIKSGVSLCSVVVGRYTYFAHGSYFRNVTIGRYCSFGPELFVGDLPRHPMRGMSTHPVFYITSKEYDYVAENRFESYANTVIGSDVFIGARCLIMPGVKIGHGAVIAAGSVVLSDVAPYSVVAGVPAVFKKKRLPSDVVDFLLAAKWWDLPESKIRVIARALKSPDRVELDELKRIFSNL